MGLKGTFHDQNWAKYWFSGPNNRDMERGTLGQTRPLFNHR